MYISPSDIIQHWGGKSPIPILLRMHNACELRSIYPTSTLDAPQRSRFIERAIDGTSVKKQVVQPAIQAHGWKATKESSMPRRYGCFKQAECSEIRTKLIPPPIPSIIPHLALLILSEVPTHPRQIDQIYLPSQGI